MRTTHIHSAMLTCALLLLGACQGNTTYVSSVPSYPVGLTIDTSVGMYVHFVSANIYDYTTIDKNGFHYKKQTMPLTASDMIGYAGILVYIDGGNHYTAYDLCCPKCVKRDSPVVVDGIYAHCPTCGEDYDLSFGMGNPTHGISNETLRRYLVGQNGSKLRIYQ